jgi:hypothetical protein
MIKAKDVVHEQDTSLGSGSITYITDSDVEINASKPMTQTRDVAG